MKALKNKTNKKTKSYQNRMFKCNHKTCMMMDKNKIAKTEILFMSNNQKNQKSLNI